ncbi:MAG: UDP-2,3-diacylglucosamine diphosphatase LpxI [Pseudomonadota bacterium]
MSRLAILAFGGGLPGALAVAHPDALFVDFGASVPPPGIETFKASVARWGAMIEAVRAGGVTDMVLAGGLRRPNFNPLELDDYTKLLLPRLAPVLAQGDDALLRFVIGVFEAEGFTVRGAHTLLPGLTRPEGSVAGVTPSAADELDIAKARAILEALGREDVGQGAVVRAGLCVGIETVQGTDAMLEFVARTRDDKANGGVLVKAPKPGQDLRVDMPAIGPGTVAAARAAGLNGIAIAAGSVVVLDSAQTIADAEAAGLFIVALAF